MNRPEWARKVSTSLASTGFVVLIAGITYFAILVYSVHFGEGVARAAAYRELGMFLSGGLAWWQDGRVYGAIALLFSLISVLFCTHPLARITTPIAGAAYVVLHFWGNEVRGLLEAWARIGD
ncbi:MAG: hypothetical protein ACYTGV_00090 [Planctomycetota bacterium]